MQVNQTAFQKECNLVLSFLDKIRQTAQYNMLCVWVLKNSHLKLKTSWEVWDSRKNMDDATRSFAVTAYYKLHLVCKCRWQNSF